MRESSGDWADDDDGGHDIGAGADAGFNLLGEGIDADDDDGDNAGASGGGDWADDDGGGGEADD